MQTNNNLTVKIFHSHPHIKQPVFPPKPTKPVYPDDFIVIDHIRSIKNRQSLSFEEICYTVKTHFPQALSKDVSITYSYNDDDDEYSFYFVWKESVMLSQEEFQKKIDIYNKEIEEYNHIMSKYDDLLEEYKKQNYEYEIQFANYKRDYLINKVKEIESYILNLKDNKTN